MNLSKLFVTISKEEKYQQSMNNGRTFLGNCDYPQAILEFQKALTYPFADRFEVHYRIGKAYFFLKKFSQAAEYLKIATEITSSHGDALYLYGTSLFSALNFEKAKEVFLIPTRENIQFC